MADVTTTFAARDESFAKTVGNLQNRLTEFGGGVDGFNSKVAGMASSFAKFAGPIAAVATAFFGVKAAADAFGNALAMGGRLDDLTKRTGATAGEMLLLEKAFDLAGSSAEAVGPTISKLNRFLAEASEAGSAQSATLQNLGLTYTQLAELSPSEQMKLLAERISSIESPALKTQAAMDVFGKSGGELIPLLSDFSGELSKAGRFLGSLPGIMSENAAAFADLDDNVSEIRGKFDQLVAGLMTGMVPALTSVTDKLANLDAAGFGMMLSQYAKDMLKAVAEAYKLASAIDSIKLAIESITQGNFSDGLSLMWVTMKVTALNAINTITANFTAGLKTVADFMSEMFGPDSGIVKLASRTIDYLGSNFEARFAAAIASILDALPFISQSVVNDFKRISQEAESSAELIKGFMGNAAKQIASDLAIAGRAMPENFEKHKSALDPIFDLTGVLDEQARLHELIGQELQAAELVTTSIKKTTEELALSLQRAEQHLQNSQILTGDIKLNLEGANTAAQNIPSAFNLSTNSSGEIKADLNNTAGSADGAAMSLEEGSSYTGQIDINGKSFAGSAANAAESIKGAKIDAQITSDLFKGLSDRMNTAVNATSIMLDKMRESFSFGQQTSREIYQESRKAGKNILEASRDAAEYTKRQERQNADMRRLENKVALTERQYDRRLARADDMERRGYWRSADNLRRTAEASYTKQLEKIRPELEKGSEAARKNLEKGSETIGKSGDAVESGGKDAGTAMERGGKDAGAALEKAADPFKRLADMIGQDKLALEATLKKCSEFLKNIDEKLPLNALS